MRSSKCSTPLLIAGQESHNSPDFLPDRNVVRTQLPIFHHPSNTTGPRPGDRPQRPSGDCDYSGRETRQGASRTSKRRKGHGWQSKGCRETWSKDDAEGITLGFDPVYARRHGRGFGIGIGNFVVRDQQAGSWLMRWTPFPTRARSCALRPLYLTSFLLCLDFIERVFGGLDNFTQS